MDEPRPPSGFPLAALFVLVAVFAILAAMLGLAVKAMVVGEVGFQVVAAAMVLSMFCWSVPGLVVGLFHHQQVRGVLVGGASGAIVGLFIGPLMAVPVESFGSLIAAGLGGSATLVLVGAVFRFTARE
jgi:hypothetical protein